MIAKLKLIEVARLIELDMQIKTSVNKNNRRKIQQVNSYPNHSMTNENGVKAKNSQDYYGK